jgi:hypothetical protein
MGVYNGERGREMYGEMGVEADGMDVEERDQGSACMVGELSEKFGTKWRNRDDKSVWT